MYLNTEIAQYKQLRIRYIKAGEGRHLILAFHGFSRTPEEFLPLMKGRENDYTLLSFYLPGHATAEPLESKNIDVIWWCKLMENLIDEHQAENVTVLGYSLGGRIALHTCMLWGLKNYKLLLLAPDGIKVHPLQRIAMQYNWGMRIFGWVMKHPKTTITLCRVFAALKMMDRGQHQFLSRQFKEESKRRTIEKVFPLFRFFLSDADSIREFISRRSDSIRIFLGERDGVIPPNVAENLSTKVRADVVKILPDVGHDLLSESNMHVWSTELRQ